MCGRGRYRGTGRRSPIRRGGGRGPRRQRLGGGPPGWVDRAGAGVASAAATSSLDMAWTMRSSGQPSPSFAFWIPRTSDRRLSRRPAARLAPGPAVLARRACRLRRTRRRAGWRSPCGCWRSPRRASRRRAGRGSSGLRCRSCRCPASPARGSTERSSRGAGGSQRSFALGNEVFPGDEA